MQYPCPADEQHDTDDCGRSFGTKNGAVMHAINKEDDHHAAVESKPQAYAALPDESAPDTQDADAATAQDGGAGDLPAASMPSTDDTTDNTPDPSGHDTVDCPNCGADLGMTHDEAAAFLRSNEVELPNGETVNGAFCEDCHHLIRP